MNRGNWANNKWLLNPIDDAKKEGLDFKVCKYCGSRVDKPRWAWCSDRCVYTWSLFSRWSRMRKFVWCRAKKRCELCGNKVTLHNNKTGKPMAEIHHILPRSKGGTDEPGNLICLCFSCHRKEHDMLEDI